MATVSYRLRTKKGNAAIYIRYLNGRSIDLKTTTGLFINPIYWDFKNEKIRNVIDVPNRDELNSKLSKLKVFVIDEYNLAYSTGVVINKSWLDDTISKFFIRPKGEMKNKIEPYKIYLSDFANWWISEKAPKHKVKANKYISKATIGHYEQLLANIIKFEGKNKIQLRNITSELMDKFSHFLSEVEKYAELTAKRKMNRFKFFCERAEEENLDINKNFKSTVFIKEEVQQFKPPYLNEEEITRIFNKDFSYNEALEAARDNFIIGLWTGLRVSDFLNRLKIDNLSENFIEIKTLKTGHYVSIPIHPQVAAILRKRGGFLPRKLADSKFNKQIKRIGQIVDIDEMMLGSVTVVDEETKIKRKVIGMYPKYKLITSHICRRSFCTNLFGKVPNKVIMDVAGWKTEQQMLDYNKATNKDSAIVLQKYWENKI